MTGALGRRSEAHKQRLGVGAVRWQGAELVAPEPKGPPRAQLFRAEADHVGMLAGLRDELEVDEPHFIEDREQIRDPHFHEGRG